MAAKIKPRPVVFLDRDGTLVYDRPGHYLKHHASMRIYPYTAQALKLLKSVGYDLVILTNQSGLAHGYLDERMLSMIHAKLRAALRRRGARFDAIYYCPHRPEDRCKCRKPKTPLARRAIRDRRLTLKGAAIIGDKLADVDLGRNLGIPSVHVLTGHGRNERRKHGKSLRPTHTASNVLSAARWVVRHCRRPS